MLEKFVTASTLNGLLRKGIINKEGVRLLDCSFAVSAKPDWKRHKEELHGKFQLIMDAPTPSKKLYLSGHIPEAVHMSLDAAMYPSQYERFAMYTPELFQEYARLLGIHKDEHLILYSRGALGGMLFSGKCAWLFKSYGHDAVSVLDGGFARWVGEQHEVSTDDVKLPPGDWVAKDRIKDFNVTFEELEEKDGDDVELLRKTNDVNFLDTRIRGQFEGTEDTGLDPYRVGGSHIPGFKNTPTVELISSEGLIADHEAIKTFLDAHGVTPTHPTITSCNTGMQAALMSYIIEDVVRNGKPRCYGGSLKEMEIRAPKKISGGRVHLPA